MSLTFARAEKDFRELLMKLVDDQQWVLVQKLLEVWNAHKRGELQ